MYILEFHLVSMVLHLAVQFLYYGQNIKPMMAM